METISRFIWGASEHMMKHGDEDGQRVRDNVMGLCSVVPVASMRSALEAQVLEPVSKTAWDNIDIDSQNACFRLFIY